ncbi:hypothetical protein [Streptomyces sp. NPDC002328]|uniref:hypothetical protein n=1 Tax=Streptomyces sp. NPDC002328 TaxID=3364642 RepID=UPI0036C6A99C
MQLEDITVPLLVLVGVAALWTLESHPPPLWLAFALCVVTYPAGSFVVSALGLSGDPVDAGTARSVTALTAIGLTGLALDLVRRRRARHEPGEEESAALDEPAVTTKESS